MKMFNQKININDPVKVKLTEYGMQIYMAYSAEQLKKSSIKPTKPKKDEQGFITLPFHRLVNIFGVNLTPVEGAELFENNEIVFETPLIIIEDEVDKIHIKEHEQTERRNLAENTKYKKGEKVVLITGGIDWIFTYQERLCDYGDLAHRIIDPQGRECDQPIWALRYANKEELVANKRLSLSGLKP